MQGLGWVTEEAGCSPSWFADLVFVLNQTIFCFSLLSKHSSLNGNGHPRDSVGPGGGSTRCAFLS